MSDNAEPTTKQCTACQREVPAGEWGGCWRRECPFAIIPLQILQRAAQDPEYVM